MLAEQAINGPIGSSQVDGLDQMLHRCFITTLTNQHDTKILMGSQVVRKLTQSHLKMLDGFFMLPLLKMQRTQSVAEDGAG